jgi:hypothetical protein
MRNGKAHGHRIVGPMDLVSAIADSEAHLVLTQRAFRSRWNDFGQRVAARSVTQSNRLRML